MNINRRVIAIVILLVSAVLANAAGIRENKAQTVHISGRVRLTGSGPLAGLVITTEDREWHIDQADQQKLWQLQQQIVTVEGTEYFRDLTFANGSPAGRQYFLKDIKIIAPEK
jgi:hypothetical protein